MFKFFKSAKEEILPIDDPASIGNVLKSTGAINDSQFREIVILIDKYPDKKFGEIAVYIGACTDRDVLQAIDFQKRLRRGKLGRIAVLAEMQKVNIERSREVQKRREQIGINMMQKVH